MNVMVADFHYRYGMTWIMRVELQSQASLIKKTSMLITIIFLVVHKHYKYVIIGVKTAGDGDCFNHKNSDTNLGFGL